MRVELTADAREGEAAHPPGRRDPEGAVREGRGQPKDMLRVAGERTDLPLRATAYTSRNPASDEVKIVALFEGIEPTRALAAASVGLFDEKNTLKKQWTAQSGRSREASRDGGADGAARQSIALRVAAVDARGARRHGGLRAEARRCRAPIRSS